MAEIPYGRVAEVAARWRPQGPDEAPAVILVHGEELLTRQVLDTLLERLLAGTSRAVGYEPLEGLNSNVPEALARLNTYSLLAGPRVVALTEARVFYGRQDQSKLRDKVRKAAREGQIPKAARYLMDLLGMAGLEVADVRPPAGDGADALGFTGDDRGWLDPVLAHAREAGLQPAAGQDPEKELLEAMAKGFPPGHRLLITADSVDKRRKLYKQIQQSGLVVDCSVPRGDRKADRAAQEAVVDATLDGILKACGKRLEPAARAALLEMTGFELRLLAGNTEKLAHYVGAREAITAADVQACLVRTRQEPLYELTDAFTDRDLDRALLMLGRLLDGGEFDHPLPLLAAMVNQVRKLLMVKDFTASPHGRAWQPGCPYPRFQQQVLPAVRLYDEALASSLADGDEGAAFKTDLTLSPGSRSPFPLFRLLQKAERFRAAELENALEVLYRADRRLKSSAGNGRLVLEQAQLAICRPADADERRPAG
jgi:DNA polymerase-3 subunit delta